MLGYAAKRLLVSIPVIFGILVVTFALARLIPGDPCKAMLGDKVSAETCQAFVGRYGLDQSLVSQFLIYISDIAHGNFGNSIRFSRPVSQIIVERLPLTAELAFLALIVSIGIATVSGDSKVQLEDLLRKSDIALYRAKNRGKQQCVVYTLDLENESKSHPDCQGRV